MHLLMSPLELVLAMSQNNSASLEATDDRCVTQVLDVQEHGRDPCQASQPGQLSELDTHHHLEHASPRSSVASFEALQAQQDLHARHARTLGSHNPLAAPNGSHQAPYGLFSPILQPWLLF